MLLSNNKKLFPGPTQSSLSVPFYGKAFDQIFSFVSIPLACISDKIILFLFIGSFFFGIPCATFVSSNYNSAALNFAWIAFTFIALGFFSFLLRKGSIAPTIPKKSKKVVAIMLIYFLWCFLSSLANLPNHSVNFGIMSIWFTINLFQLPVALYIFSTRKICDQREYILDIIILFSFFEIFVALCQHFIVHDDSVRGTLGGHHAMLGIMMGVSAAVMLYRIIITEKYRRILYMVGFSLSLYAIILSGCRSMLTGIFIATILFFFSSIKFNAKYLVALIGVLLLSVLTLKATSVNAIINRTIHSTDTPMSVDMSSFGRLLIWKGSVSHFLHASLFEKLIGVGMGCFSSISLDIFIFNNNFAGGAHNNFLHVLMETGVIGLVLFSALFFAIFRSLIPSFQSDPLAKPFFFLTIALLSSGFTQETFWFQPVFGSFWLYNVILLGLILGNSGKYKPGGDLEAIHDYS